MKPRHVIHWRWLARIGAFSGAALLVIAIALLFFSSWLYAYRFTHAGCAGQRKSLEGSGYPSEPVQFETQGGYALRGWFSRGKSYPQAAIIVEYGAFHNTEFALPDAELLAEAGYSTLVYEHRSCADPALVQTAGYLEAGDLASAVRYLQGRGGIRHIGALGFSASGTAALLAAAQEPGLEAVVAEGGFSSLVDDVLWDEPHPNPVDWVFRRMTVWFLGKQMGVSPSLISPVDHIADISPRPLLLIYGENEAWHGQKLFAAAGEPKELWIVPGVGHGGYQAADPEAYSARIVEFFNAAFLP